jgi:phage gpG-like protein
MPRKRREEFPDFKKEVNQALRFFDGLGDDLGQMALNFFDDSWEREGFPDQVMNKWPLRKQKDRNERERGKRGLLMQTGFLRRSGDFRISGDMIIFRYAGYGEAHNWGFTGRQNVKEHTRNPQGKKKHTVKAHTRQVHIPQRQFVGHSEVLDKRMKLHVDRALDWIFP